jgi:hypothetical protein
MHTSGGFEAVHDRHVMVHHHHVGPRAGEDLQRLEPVARLSDDRAVLLPEHLLQQRAHLREVVHDDDAGSVALAGFGSMHRCPRHEHTANIATSASSGLEDAMRRSKT